MSWTSWGIVSSSPSGSLFYKYNTNIIQKKKGKKRKKGEKGFYFTNQPHIVDIHIVKVLYKKMVNNIFEELPYAMTSIFGSTVTKIDR